MSMFSSGVLVLTSPLHALPFRLGPVLKSAAKLVDRTLYVHLHPGLNLETGCVPRPAFVPPSADLPGLISRLYSNAADVCAHLDVRLLLANICAQHDPTLDTFPSPQTLSQSPEVVMTDFPVKDMGQTSLVERCLEVYAGSCYVCSPSLSSVILWPQLKESLKEQEENWTKTDSQPVETYGDVVVGGTFDRLHGAHRTLLNICSLMANRRLVIGVCDQELLKSKVLKELIEPYGTRVQKLHEFLSDVKPSLQYEIVPLSDPFGPSVSDPKLQCIVVSEETKRGGEAVNRKRVENGLTELVLYEIPLIKDTHRADIEEEKISSSSLRTRLLGTLLVPPAPGAALPELPYVIGLTGGSGSGKSSIARRLEGLGAARIDADQLGHDTYRPGTAAYQKIVEEFGTDVVKEDQTIDRRVLGMKVFGNQIARLVKERIQQAKADGKRVCVLDAAVLLQAGWTDIVHEVWVAIIPEDEVTLVHVPHLLENSVRLFMCAAVCHSYICLHLCRSGREAYRAARRGESGGRTEEITESVV
ncbi:Bifunctional coenzyme A synthase [Bagarius yarrelli]|uniref:Bifunctional coenzyme A synthase n=1 Tax=Bagarius yarrelli TaxID=175774 RepID=A0A556U1H3_BAGYA|nr:Bifunctional coenzyme A synthase [Bagarius yarrelli]